MKADKVIAQFLKSERAVIDYRSQSVGLVVTDMHLTIPEMKPHDKGITFYSLDFNKRILMLNSKLEVITRAIVPTFTDRPIGPSLSQV